MTCIDYSGTRETRVTNKLRYVYIILSLVVIFAVTLYSMRHVTEFEKIGDTEVYRTSIETWGGWAEWVEAYYNGNSGRVLIHAMLILIVNCPIIVYKLLSASMVTLTCFMFYKYSCAAEILPHSWSIKLSLIVAPIVYYLIPSSIIGNSVRWAPGALNYLFPVTAMLVCLYPFYLYLKRKPISLVLKIVSAALICLCGNMEQASAVYVTMGLLVFFYCRIIAKTPVTPKDSFFLIGLWIVNLIVFLISYLAPGNALRYQEELLRCVGYEMQNLIDKLILGYQLVWLNFSSVFGFLIWMIPSGLLVLKYIMSKEWHGLTFPLLFIILSAIQNILVRKVFNLEHIYPNNIAYMLWLVFSFGLVFANASIILRGLKSDDDKFWYIFLYYGALTAGIIVAVSPTLYVSAGRTLYITFVLYCAIIVKIFSELHMVSNHFGAKYPFMHIFNRLLGVVCLLLIAIFFVLSSSKTAKIDANDYRCNLNHQIERVQFHEDTNTITMTIDITPFAYTANNWCLGPIEGYDINVRVGVMDTVTKEITAYKTCTNTLYPVMETFPDSKVDITAYINKGVILNENEIYVMVCTLHNGSVYYTPIS